MKALFSIFIFTVLNIQLHAQALNGPESVAWDPASNRYFVSNNGANQILVRSTSGVYTVFTTNISSGPHGLEVVGNTLYACDGSNIKGFDLTTAALVLNVNTGAAFLNGICSDGGNNLFSTDFTNKKIYRINIVQQTFTVFVTGLVKQPNGIFYDQPGGRLVWVCWGNNAPIMQALLSDSTVSQVTATTLGNCDGLVQDGAGNYYVSAWNTNSIYRFTNSFGSPTAVVTGLSSPADIYYNLVTDTLASPNSGSNTVTFHYFGTTGVKEGASVFSNVLPYPVPSGREVTVEMELTSSASVSFLLRDMSGRLVLTGSEKHFNSGKDSFTIETSALKPGSYFMELHAGEITETRKIIVEE
jgi:sugar lactone lactonase YvrE